MRKLTAFLFIILISVSLLTGCGAVGDKSGSLSLIYGTTAALALALLVGCLILVRKKRFWFVALFSSVLVVNLGYTLLSVSTGLEMALWANRISYLGSVFLPLSMLMILLTVTNTSYKKLLPWALSCVSVVMFLIAASPGILPIYYKEVDFAVVDGVSTLVKVYGPLHPVYLVYLLGYFSAMVIVIIQANVKKAIASTAHAVIIAVAVFVNLGVWFIEQLVDIDFEMLSISYIISELFLLSVHLVMNEYQRMCQIVNLVSSVQSEPADATAATELSAQVEAVDSERIALFITGFKNLTPSERSLYDAYIARMTTKEIMAKMNIKESTVKYHSRNLYSKLGVSSRKELWELQKQIRSVKANLGDAEGISGK